jgi:catechol 2,3-dioxygenase-like lactoylglutathione lyase family enzyme
MSNPLAVGHIAITVPDVEGAADWYQDVFGCKLLMGPKELSSEDPQVADQLHDVFGGCEVAFRQVHLEMADGVGLELFQFKNPQTIDRGEFAFWRVGIFHLCLVAPEIEEVAAKIEASGGRRRTAIRPIFPGEPYRFCYCEDPYGNIIELATHPHAEAFGGRGGY